MNSFRSVDHYSFLKIGGFLARFPDECSADHFMWGDFFLMAGRAKENRFWH